MDKLLPWFLFVGGLIDIIAGIHFLLTTPAGSRWIKCIFFGDIAIIFGTWWYVDINKLSTKLVTSSGILFGMFLILLAICRANFIIHSYDLASIVASVLGICITFITIFVRRTTRLRFTWFTTFGFILFLVHPIH